MEEELWLLETHDEAKIILFSANQNDSSPYLLLLVLGLFSFGPIKVCWEAAEQVVYGSWAKKEANVISYFLMTSEWHPCMIESR